MHTSASRVVLLALLSITVFGCTHTFLSGRDFNAKFRNELVLNQTKKTDIEGALGSPEKKETVSVMGINHELYLYSFAKGEYPNPPSLRMLKIDLKNNVVQGWEFVSSFPDDLPTFNESRITRLVPYKTEKSEVLALFGAPHGRLLLPSALARLTSAETEHSTEVWSYRAQVWDEQRKNYGFSSLDIFFDVQGVMTKKIARIFDKTPSGQVQHSFIAFNDSSQCKDYGDISSVKKSNSTILQLPFLIRLNDEGEVSKESYPRTENEIDRHIESALRSSVAVLVLDTQAPGFKEISEYLRSVMNTVGYRTDSPLEWGQSILEGTLDRNTYIYFPIGIERESKHHINARFYVLIADSTGRVIFARCMPYNPNNWSENIESFKKDVKGKLPLAD